MATTSIVPALQDALVTQFTTALATASRAGGQVPVDVAWPGPATQLEAVFLGYLPGERENRITVEHEIPTMKAGRKYRQESYSQPVTIICVRPDLSAGDAGTVRDQAFTILGLLEGVLADDPTIGLSSIQHATSGDFVFEVFPRDKGYGAEIVWNVDVQARLT